MPRVVRASLGVLLAFGMVVGAWMLHLAPLLNPPKSKPTTHQFILESIPPSHCVEKVRWCLDLAGASYVEVCISCRQRRRDSSCKPPAVHAGQTSVVCAPFVDSYALDPWDAVQASVQLKTDKNVSCAREGL